jgi:peroxiredoxin
VIGLYGSESPEKLAEFVEQTGITFPIMKDQSTLGLYAFPDGVGYPYPRDVVIDKNGVVRSIKNSFDAGAMDTLVQELLAE